MTKENKWRYEKDCEPEENAENCLCCLKYDNLTAEEFDQCWKACASYRLCEIKDLPTTKSILERWKFYKAYENHIKDKKIKTLVDKMEEMQLFFGHYMCTLSQPS
ncbi:hypothetical protein QE152_g36162 [Popillia japonica]|uniref:Uncharacterized protein n=1 Tax=Popillia japonica TaxID=7064 RepID=A0AAW1ID14_POPJA